MQTKLQTQLCPNPKCGADNPLSANNCPRCGEPQRQLLGRGTILQSRYRIESLRGCGGFGAVYRATDLQTGQTVAIKENHQYRTFARFEREGKLLMKLSHPNLPKVHEVFIDQVTGRAYLVMDFVNGETLQEMVERVGRLSWKDAEPIFAQVVEALTYLHGQNIVHRDIKPSNVIVTNAIVPPPNLNEKIVVNETDGERFVQGMNYWRVGWRLEELQRSGWTLSGKCWGDVDAIGRRRRYSLSATLTNNGIGMRHCECSDFRGRRLCKHLVALLLAWIHEPQRFKVVSEKRTHQHTVLVDFGVAKVMEAVDPNRPRSSSIVAWTDGYSPPEQYQSGVEVDSRADQYALAATMVFTLTGQIPYDALTRMGKFSRGEPTLPPKPDDVPENVWRAIEAAMRFQPEQRFSSVSEFWKAVKGEIQPPPQLTIPPSRRSVVREFMSVLSFLIVYGGLMGALVGYLLGIRDPIEGGVILGAVLLGFLSSLTGLLAHGSKGVSGNGYSVLGLGCGGLVVGSLVGGTVGVLLAFATNALLALTTLRLEGVWGSALYGALLMAVIGIFLMLFAALGKESTSTNR